MHAALLLSGGVDSSVALVRLQESGARVTAFYLKVWLEEELAGLGDCPWQEDLEYARAVCEQRRVPLHVVSVQQEYLERVLDYVVRELRAGNTPSPDLMCNRHIKFGVFTERFADGFDTVATGHYARVVDTGAGPRLRTAPDPVKDQTYFLAYVSAGQLARAAFPIGDSPKAVHPRRGGRARPADPRAAGQPGHLLPGPDQLPRLRAPAAGRAARADRGAGNRPPARRASRPSLLHGRPAAGTGTGGRPLVRRGQGPVRTTGSPSAARRPHTRTAPSD